MLLLLQGFFVSTSGHVMRCLLFSVAGLSVFFILVIVIAGRLFLSVNMPLTKADAIVILAGNYEERVPHAAALFSAGYANTILLTNDGVRRGWSREHQRNLYSNERSTELLVQLGVPRKSVISLPFFKSGTVYDAMAVREYIHKHKSGSVLLVTSDYHARRSLWIFRRVLQSLPVVVTINPSHSSAALISDIALELIKLAYYLICFGWQDDISGAKL